MRFLLLTFGTVAVVGGVLAVMAVVGNPKPSCADGTVAATRTGEDGFNTKWSGFDAAVKRGEAATVTFTEEELTSRGARYLRDSNVPAEDLQIHLCSGGGKGQAAMGLEVLGQSVAVVVDGHLDLAAAPPRIVVDSLQLGAVPEQVATLAANQLLQAANVQVPREIRDVSTTSTAATLRGQR